MVRSLPLDERTRRLADLDHRYEQRGVPLRLRPSECFKELYGSVGDSEGRHELFDPITVWFVEQYGDEIRWDKILARIPVLLRGRVYSVTVPFVTEDTVMRLTDRFEGLPANIAKDLSEDEFSRIGHKVSAATEAVQKLYTLRVDDVFLDSEDRQLISRAQYDLEHASNSIIVTGDTQNAIFHSHAAAEKFLKVALARETGDRQQFKSLAHNLPRILRKLIQSNPTFDWLQSSIDELQKNVPNMAIRYSDLPRSQQSAVVCFDAALSVCGTVAGILIFDGERGTSKASFQVGQFYLDGARRTFRCVQFPTADSAILRIFQSHAAYGMIMADIRLKVKYGRLYLEETDSAEIHKLQQMYATHLRHRGQPITPSEIRLQQSSGPEGSYVSSVIKRRIHPDVSNES
jgi:HEPN domain-containing protein